MVKCEYCINFDGKRCTDPKGVMYNKDIIDPMEDIECDRYIDKYLAYGAAEGIL